MENQEITFEQLPQAVNQLCQDMAFLKKHLLEKNNLQNAPVSDQWFDLSQLCNYLPDKPAKATIYAYVSANAIPCHKGAKKLRFLKSEIDEWLKKGKKKTGSDLEKEADIFLSTLKRKGGRNDK